MDLLDDVELRLVGRHELRGVGHARLRVNADEEEVDGPSRGLAVRRLELRGVLEVARIGPRNRNKTTRHHDDEMRSRKRGEHSPVTRKDRSKAPSATTE